MKTAALLILVSACVAHADFSYNRVRYWYHLQGVTNDTSGVVVSAAGGVESGHNSAWGAKPTVQDLSGIDESTAWQWAIGRDKPTAVSDAEARLKVAVGKLFPQVTWPVSNTTASTYKTALKNMAQECRDEIDAAETWTDAKVWQRKLNLIQQVVNLVRELEALDPSWSLGDVR